MNCPYYLSKNQTVGGKCKPVQHKPDKGNLCRELGDQDKSWRAHLLQRVSSAVLQVNFSLFMPPYPRVQSV